VKSWVGRVEAEAEAVEVDVENVRVEAEGGRGGGKSGGSDRRRKGRKTEWDCSEIWCPFLALDGLATKQPGVCSWLGSFGSPVVPCSVQPKVQLCRL
jgi:hypothetical protein